MEDKNNIVNKDSEATIHVTSKSPELIDCRHGWNCHGRKSGKCPYSHPDTKPFDSNSNTNSSYNPPKLIDCKNGYGCHGRKSGKCPFSHPEIVGSVASVAICKNGPNCYRHKRGECHYLH